ncbi:MAG: hypothetical protein MUF18_05950 [Fimbriiglobus sp.]|jgi:hypothetical protein|nr:hypothetical protein [Fimbriiglobus sp.]
MSTVLHDIPSHTALAVALGPRVVAEEDTGPAVELPGADGPAFAVAMFGVIDPGTTVSITLEESAGDGTWTEVAEMPPATSFAASAVAFTPSARLLRCRITPDGPAPQAEVAILLGRQKKVI